MFGHLRTLTWRIVQLILSVGWYGLDILCWSWDMLRYQDDQIPMEVLVANRPRRHGVERRLRRGVRQLQHILGERPLPDVAIVVQQIIMTDRQLVGCCHLGHRPDGTPYALWRLALHVHGRPVSSDELLAALAEQWLALASQKNGSSVLIPVDFEPPKAGAPLRSSTPRGDPLAPFADGTNPYRA